MQRSTKTATKNFDLPIVLVGDISSPMCAPSNTGVETGDLLLDVTVGAKSDPTDPFIDLDESAFRREALVRIAKQEGISLDEARRIVLAAQVARRERHAVQVEEIDLMEQVVGYLEVDRRTVRKCIHKVTKNNYPEERKDRGLTTTLGKIARRAKWVAFESLDTEVFLLAAEAAGMKVAMVTFKVPKVEDWIELDAASTPTKFKGKDGALQKTLRTLGSKFSVPGFGKAFRGVWVLENTTRGVKRPHIHAVMMVPEVGGEEFIRETWLKKTGFPVVGGPDSVVHVRWEDKDDERSVVEQFRDASRYLSRNKHEQERVNQEWLDRNLEVGHMWDTRGFKSFPKERFEIRRKHVEPVREVMTEVSSRPAMTVDVATGELVFNPYGRWVRGSAYGNTEVMDDTSVVTSRLLSVIEVEPEGDRLN